MDSVWWMRWLEAFKFWVVYKVGSVPAPFRQSRDEILEVCECRVVEINVSWVSSPSSGPTSALVRTINHHYVISRGPCYGILGLLGRTISGPLEDHSSPISSRTSSESFPMGVGPPLTNVCLRICLRCCICQRRLSKGAPLRCNLLPIRLSTRLRVGSFTGTACLTPI
jgi:hypothetical protein